MCTFCLEGAILPRKEEFVNENSTWVLDLDGVIWLGDEAIPGSREAISILRDNGRGVLLVTNNSRPTVIEYLDKLSRFGIDVSTDELISSSIACASLIVPGERVYVIGGDGLKEAIRSSGGVIVEDHQADVVAVGWSKEFNYEMMSVALKAILDGARFLATNEDPTYPTPYGLVPGAGAIVRSIAYASSCEPTVAGKPHEPIAKLVRERVGPGSVMVGDRHSTDGVFAGNVGLPFYLVFSGVTKAADPNWKPSPARIGKDLLDLVRCELAL